MLCLSCGASPFSALSVRVLEFMGRPERVRALARRQAGSDWLSKAFFPYKLDPIYFFILYFKEI